MNKRLNILAAAAVLAVAAAPALFAQEQQKPPTQGPAMGQGMMGQDGMMPMMNMMGQMSQMMAACTQMMQSASGGHAKPSEQMPKDTPAK